MTPFSESTSPSPKEITSQNVPVTVPGAAKVNLEVHDFRDVLAPDPPIRKGERSATCPPNNVRGTPYKMSMTDTHPQVEFFDPPDNTTLRVKPPGATLLFTITSSESNPREEYYPVGITFFLVKGKPTDDDRKRLGFLNFAQLKILPNKQAHSLSITDSYNKEYEQHERYKFSVIIQRARDGKIGIIDPFIINEP